MKYIQQNPNPSGAYSAPQSQYAEGLIPISDVQADILIQYNGFVTIEDGAVTPNLEAWEIWKQEFNADMLSQFQSDKISELSTACNQAITAGMDVETTEGTEHFSLEETDQINLTAALSAVEQGAKGYPYHADKKLCRMFTAVEIKSIAETATKHKLYHTTLCNHLLIWARRVTTVEELEQITYTAENLPTDLAENMAKVLAASGVSE